MRIRCKKGFTLVELIVTITLLGLLLIPLGIMSMEFVQAIVYSRDIGVAEALAKIEMAKINNLAYSDATLTVGYDNTTPNYEGYAYNLRRTVSAGPVLNSKQVQVRVFPSGNTTNPLVNVITYLADVTFGAGSGGGGAGGGAADSLAVSGGSILGTNLQNVTLANTGAANITITGVTISFTGASGIKCTTITMDGTQRWSGNARIGATITLDTPFTLVAKTTYTNTGLFAFSKNLTSATIIFIMSDASQTTSYSW